MLAAAMPMELLFTNTSTLTVPVVTITPGHVALVLAPLVTMLLLLSVNFQFLKVTLAFEETFSAEAVHVAVPPRATDVGQVTFGVGVMTVTGFVWESKSRAHPSQGKPSPP